MKAIRFQIEASKNPDGQGIEGNEFIVSKAVVAIQTPGFV
jgi:hypothetical protein